MRTRTRYVALIKATVRREGLRLPQGEPEPTERKLAAIDLPAPVVQELTPLVALLGDRVRTSGRDGLPFVALDVPRLRMSRIPGNFRVVQQGFPRQKGEVS